MDPPLDQRVVYVDVPHTGQYVCEVCYPLGPPRPGVRVPGVTSNHNDYRRHLREKHPEQVSGVIFRCRECGFTAPPEPEGRTRDLTFKAVSFHIKSRHPSVVVGVGQSAPSTARRATIRAAIAATTAAVATATTTVPVVARRVANTARSAALSRTSGTTTTSSTVGRSAGRSTATTTMSGTRPSLTSSTVAAVQRRSADATRRSAEIPSRVTAARRSGESTTTRSALNTIVTRRRAATEPRELAPAPSSRLGGRAVTRASTRAGAAVGATSTRTRPTRPSVGNEDRQGIPEEGTGTRLSREVDPQTTFAEVTRGSHTPPLPTGGGLNDVLCSAGSPSPSGDQGDNGAPMITACGAQDPPQVVVSSTPVTMTTATYTTSVRGSPIVSTGVTVSPTAATAHALGNATPPASTTPRSCRTPPRSGRAGITTPLAESAATAEAGADPLGPRVREWTRVDGGGGSRRHGGAGQGETQGGIRVGPGRYDVLRDRTRERGADRTEGMAGRSAGRRPRAPRGIGGSGAAVRPARGPPGANGQNPRRADYDELVRACERVVSTEDLERLAASAAAFFNGSKEPRGDAGRPAGADRRAAGGRQRERGTGPRAHGPESTVEEAARIQRLYRNNRRRAMQQVLREDQTRCQVNPALVEEHFSTMHRSRDAECELRLPRMDPPSDASCDALEAPFSPGEVAKKLRKMTNSSPGPDGLTYRELREADRSGRILAAYFNTCVRLGCVPGSWKESNTILLFKKGDKDDLSNWRPIAMGNTIAKLFAGLLADRLTRWAVVNSRLSASQKGFLQYEGCYEHNFVLQEIIRDARRRRKELVVAWLDLSNAFGSVPHAAIAEALRQHGVPDGTRRIIMASYSGMTTRVGTAHGATGLITIASGVRQGCPLSPIVFNLTLEPVLRTLAAQGEGYTLWGRSFNNLTYADDTVLIAKTQEEMAAQLRAVEAEAEAIGLSFNSAKCASLHVAGGREAGPRSTAFSLRAGAIKSLGVGEAYDHLGIPTGFQVRQTPIASIQELVRDLHAVDGSALAPWQKLDAVATFLLPRLDFLLRGAHIEKGPLTEADRFIKRAAKGWLNLPQRASAEVVFLPPNQGGAGLLPLADMADLMTVAHAFKMLTALDPVVSGLAMDSLRDEVRRTIGREPDNTIIAQYLSGSSEGVLKRRKYGPASMWGDARSAARRQAEHLSLSWRWSEHLSEFALECRGLKGGRVIIPPAARWQVIGRLRAAVAGRYRGSLLAKKDQGKVFEVSSRCGVSNHFLRDGRNTRFAEWRFLHRARLNVLPLNGARRWGEGDTRCRRCGEGQETLPHVIGHCGPHANAIQRRHDAIVDRLAKALHLPGDVRRNRPVEGAEGELANLRPDLVIRDERRRKITVVDVTVPFENRLEAFREARARKLAKYEPLAENLRRRGYDVTVEAFVIGALGSWDPASERVIGRLKINARYAAMMRRLMVSDTIRWSRDIYVEHVSGVRQYIAVGTDARPIPSEGDRGPPDH